MKKQPTVLRLLEQRGQKVVEDQSLVQIRQMLQDLGQSQLPAHVLSQKLNEIQAVIAGMTHRSLEHLSQVQSLVQGQSEALAKSQSQTQGQIRNLGQNLAHELRGLWSKTDQGTRSLMLAVILTGLGSSILTALALILWMSARYQ